MSRALSDLCTQLCGDMFGEVVQSIVQYLITAGPSSLPSITVHTPYPRRHTQLALQVLLSHSLVHVQNTKARCLYSAVPRNILELVRYSRYLWLLSQDGASRRVHCTLLRHVLNMGRCSTAQLLEVAEKQLSMTDRGGGCDRSTSSQDCLSHLVSRHYLVSCRNDTDPAEDEKVSDLLLLRKVVDPAGGADEVWWRVNYERLHVLCRDDLLLRCAASACGESVPSPASLIMSHLLSHEACDGGGDSTGVLGPVSVTQLRHSLSSKSVSSEHNTRALQHLEQYLRVLSEAEPALCDKCGDAGGGQYRVNMGDIFSRLVWCVADDVVQERLGSRAGRIFRVVRQHRYVEQDKIQQWSMIPQKEAKLLTYQLHRASFISTYDLRRPGQQQQSAGGRVSFLFTANYSHILHTLLQLSYRAASNSTRLRRHHTASVARLRDKQSRIDTLVNTLRQQGAEECQLEEIQQSLTDTERQQLNKVDCTVDKLLSADSHLDDTLFILTTALRYHDNHENS